MRVHLLGGCSGDGGSPRLWGTDEDSTVAVQGYLTKSAGTVEIPHTVLGYAEQGTYLTGLVDTNNGTFLVTGPVLDDPEALATMRIPAGEGAVLVRVGREVRYGAVVPA